jgi:hypothetical protein
VLKWGAVEQTVRALGYIRDLVFRDEGL